MRIFVKNFQIWVLVKNGQEIGLIEFLPFFDRIFETLAIEISEIQFHIQIPRPRIMLNPNFRLIQ